MRAAILLALLLVGCGRASRSADWFAGHAEARSLVIYRCETGRQSDAECDTARQAERRKQDARLKLFRKGF
jgi:hypothetical protein